ncbi:MAG: HDIG domain-containing protein [Sphaerochaeta sp.]|nr:HDIG domain-containing protein [Sphaerochaeta sp.]
MRQSKASQERGKRQRQIERQVSLVLMVCTVLLAMLVPVISSRSSDRGFRSLSVRYVAGELSEKDVYATSSFQYIDEIRTEALIRAHEQAVLPHFSFILRSTTLSTQRVEQFVQAWRAKGKEEALRVLGEFGLSDTKHVVARIAELPSQDQLFLLQALQETSHKVLETGLYPHGEIQTIKEQGYNQFLLTNTVSMTRHVTAQPLAVEAVMTTDTLFDSLASWLDGYKIVNETFQSHLVVDALSLLVESNVRYEEVKTLALREEAARTVFPVVVTIERGQKIIGKDTVVTNEQIDLLQRMGDQAFGYTVLELVGRAIFVLFVSAISVYVFLQFLQKDKRLYLYLNLMLFSVILSLLALYAISSLLENRNSMLLDSYLPIIFAPLFTAHITSKKRLGLVTAFLLSSFVTLMPQATSMTFFLSLSVSGVCLYFFQYTIKRLEDLFNWFYAIVISSFAAIALNVLVGIQLTSVLPLVGGIVLNVTISLVFTEALVPLCERMFNIPTAYRLSELAFSDSPVLERLSTVAQGTYNHSRYVSDLAYKAAKAIGANAMLARVGGIYHDIGKSDHPEYFIENQGSENKHDDIKPSLSVAIIKSHVKLGLEKGREVGLPQEVLDIISQHHGNDVIQFFFNEAKEQSLKAGLDVKEDDFSYSGEPPAFPESAIVMLADCVEAASRTLKKPNHSKYQKLVHSIIMGKIEREQLKNSQLSLTDLDVIEDAFVQTLIGRDHHRIQYPDEAKEERNRTEV